MELIGLSSREGWGCKDCSITGFILFLSLSLSFSLQYSVRQLTNWLGGDEEKISFLQEDFQS